MRRTPRPEMQTIEDAYVNYVLILGVPESVFWECDVSFVVTVAADKAAYDAWIAGENKRSVDEATSGR